MGQLGRMYVAGLLLRSRRILQGGGQYGVQKRHLWVIAGGEQFCLTWFENSVAKSRWAVTTVRRATGNTRS